MIHLDTETCGFVGPIVLIQYARDDGPVTLYDVWKKPVAETLFLLEMLCDNTICAFNLSFDWFHINKLYNLLAFVNDRGKPPNIKEVANNCSRQFRDYCLKPKGAIDLLLYLRKSKWQVLMDRRDIRIRRVPLTFAHGLARTLKERISLSDIFFHKRPGGEYQWTVNENGEFADVVLKFGASSALKPIIHEIFKESVMDIPLPCKVEEDSYNPYDTRWADVIHHHIEHWAFNPQARRYAKNDVEYLQRLRCFYSPSISDDDSVLAACVGSVRWRGFAVDTRAIRGQLLENDIAVKIFHLNECNPNSPPQCLEWLKRGASKLASAVIINTNAETLAELETWDDEIGRKAKTLIGIRRRAKQVNILKKLQQTARFNPDYKVIGAKSGRMSGGSIEGDAGEQINPQGIKRTKESRRLYTLADSPDILAGGDFDQFEICIMSAAYGGPNIACSLEAGKKFFAILGEDIYGETYDEILASHGTEEDHYVWAKNTGYGISYGAAEPKLAKTAHVSRENIERSLSDFFIRYPEILESRKNITDQFCSLSQPGGLGTPVIWREPADYIESLLGFRRYFTLENNITRSIFELANNLPREFTAHGRITRNKNKGEQTFRGATQSALFATAFQIQASNMRAAANHVIQSTGGEITKALQRAIWDCQPVGVHPWRVQPINNHDEVMVVHSQGLDLTNLVDGVIEKYKEVVPLLSMKWKTGLKNWSDK